MLFRVCDICYPLSRFCVPIGCVISVHLWSCLFDRTGDILFITSIFSLVALHVSSLRHPFIPLLLVVDPSIDESTPFLDVNRQCFDCIWIVRCIFNQFSSVVQRGLVSRPISCSLFCWPPDKHLLSKPLVVHAKNMSNSLESSSCDLHLNLVYCYLASQIENINLFSGHLLQRRFHFS